MPEAVEAESTASSRTRFSEPTHVKPDMAPPEVQLYGRLSRNSKTSSSKKTSMPKVTRRDAVVGSYTLARTITLTTSPDCWNCRPVREPRSTSSRPAARLA